MYGSFTLKRPVSDKNSVKKTGNKYKADNSDLAVPTQSEKPVNT